MPQHLQFLPQQQQQSPPPPQQQQEAGAQSASFLELIKQHQQDQQHRPGYY
jgi:hypothetical protein